MPGFGTLKRHKVGKLRHRCVLQRRNISGEDDRGHPVYVWESIKDPMHANIVGLHGNEAEVARKLHPEATHRIEVRADKRITEDTRILYGTREFYVGYVDDIDQVGRFAQLICAEKK